MNLKLQFSLLLRKIKDDRSGITLIELLMVVMMVAILSTLSVPFFARFFNQNAVENASVQLLGDFHKAQIYAMTGKANDNWGVHYAGNTITLYKGTAYGVDTSFNETFSVPAAVSISGFIDINFAKGTGKPSTGNPSTTPTISISAPGNNSEVITINSQGVATR